MQAASPGRPLLSAIRGTQVGGLSGAWIDEKRVLAPGYSRRKPDAYDLSPGGGAIAVEVVACVGHLAIRPGGMARCSGVRKGDRHKMIGGAMHDQHWAAHAVGELVERSRMKAQSSK
jgi:hypothetical protein